MAGFRRPTENWPVSTREGTLPVVVWGSTALALSVSEYPLLWLVTRLSGPVLQHYPAPLTVPQGRGDVYVNVSLLAGAFLFMALWPMVFAVVGVFFGADSTRRLWWASWVLMVVVLAHFAIHFAAPWVLLYSDGIGLTKDAWAAPPPYLYVLNPPAASHAELPATVLCLTAVVHWRHQRRARRHEVAYGAEAPQDRIG